MKKPSRREVMPGVILARGDSGSVSIVDHGRLAGWLHASCGSDWKAVVDPGTELGKFKGDDAVWAVVQAFRSKQQKGLIGNASA